jgi:hypothetical protein
MAKLVIEIRHAAAQKAVEGNTRSVAPAPPAPADTVDHVSAPALEGGTKSAPVATKPSEATPPYAKESLKGDGWKGAEAAAVAKMHAALKKK